MPEISIYMEAVHRLSDLGVVVPTPRVAFRTRTSTSSGG
jgi:hypothetical protein